MKRRSHGVALAERYGAAVEAQMAGDRPLLRQPVHRDRSATKRHGRAMILGMMTARSAGGGVTEDRAGTVPVQQGKPRPVGLVVAIVILLAVPSLVVGALFVVTENQFVRFEAAHGAVPMAGSRYDAYKHAYASGVVAVVFGPFVSRVAGGVVEAWEQDPCLEREKDYINNREGRRMALAIHAEQASGWRARFAETLYEALRRRDPAFSVNRGSDARVAETCASD